MDHYITRYLNQHLAASHSALSSIETLVESHDGPGARGFFLDLQEAIEADQTLMENLLEGVDIMNDDRRRIEIEGESRKSQSLCKVRP